MDHFPEISPLQWDISQHTDLSALNDPDFLSLLSKQFPAGNDASLGFPSFHDGVNPQNLSAYPLPSLTPPSEDSSPSPSNSNQDTHNDDREDSVLKRKASDESLSDEPSQKTLHTSNDKKSAGPRRKSSGGTGKDESRLMKRKEQNRAAQRAFRERKEKHVKDLEDKVAELEAKNEQAQNENENLRDLLTRLQSENVTLKQSAFTFTVPKSTPTASESAPSPQHLFPAVSSSNSASSPASSTSHLSPKMTNPLDWSSLTAFDPAVLNLLDDSVPQPTATQGAMQMDFGFGGTNNNSSGLPSNFPYTTIASNPMFMSFASTFDALTPPDASSSNSPPSDNSTNDNSSFSFDLNSLSAWPTSTPSMAQDPILDDLFSGHYMSSSASGSGMDFTMTGTPSSISPVTHHKTPSAFTSHLSPMTSSSSSSSSPSLLGMDSVFTRDVSTPGTDVEHNTDKCPTNKSEMEQRIASAGDSPFAPPNLRKSTDGALGTMITCAGSSFPKTVKSDKNVEVLTAWRSIRANPKFKDADINDLCAEFTSKARCDGTKVVLEPQGVNSILEALSKK